jgi:hypothetical protein
MYIYVHSESYAQTFGSRDSDESDSKVVGSPSKASSSNLMASIEALTSPGIPSRTRFKLKNFHA